LRSRMLALIGTSRLSLYKRKRSKRACTARGRLSSTRSNVSLLTTGHFDTHSPLVDQPSCELRQFLLIQFSKHDLGRAGYLVTSTRPRRVESSRVSARDVFFYCIRTPDETLGAHCDNPQFSQVRVMSALVSLIRAPLRAAIGRCQRREAEPAVLDLFRSRSA
jgi:hypothetical protein